MTPNYDIRPITWDEPLKKGEIELTEAEAQQLQPLNRAQRRAWAKEHRRKGSRRG